MKTINSYYDKLIELDQNHKELDPKINDLTLEITKTMDELLQKKTI